ncbi:MAG: nucleotidyltransferase family protein [Chloroflexota bacterium]
MYNYLHYINLLHASTPELQQQFRVKSLGIFGSYSHNEQDINSDLDILVSFNEVPSFVTFIRLEDRLREITGLEVDLVMEDGLKSIISQNILREVIRI